MKHVLLRFEEERTRATDSVCAFQLNDLQINVSRVFNAEYIKTPGTKSAQYGKTWRVFSVCKNSAYSGALNTFCAFTTRHCSNAIQRFSLAITKSVKEKGLHELSRMALKRHGIAYTLYWRAGENASEWNSDVAIRIFQYAEKRHVLGRGRVTCVTRSRVIFNLNTKIISRKISERKVYLFLIYYFLNK